MSNQLTLWDIPNATSLPEELFGRSLSGKPDGPMIERYGPAAAPAPASARQAKAKGLQTLVTSGLLGHDSSASATLQQSLENRLVPRLDMAGSTLFKLTWKHKTTPLGRRYLERAASVLRTSGNGFTLQRQVSEVASQQVSGWPTPQTHDDKLRGNTEADNHTFPHDLSNAVMLSSWRSPNVRLNGGGDYSDPVKAAKRLEQGHQLNLSEEVLIASWPTPQAADVSRVEMDRLKHDRQTRDPNMPGSYRYELPDVAQMASWSTPKAEDSECAGAHRGQADTLTAQTRLAAWATPTAPAPHDSEQSAGRARPRKGYGQDLAIQAGLCGWATPAERDYRTANLKSFEERGGGKKGEQLPNQVKLLAGWPTPMAGTPAQNGNNEAGNNDSSRKTVELASWPTPRQTDPKCGKIQTENCTGSDLTKFTQLAAWPTPNCPNGGRVQSDAVTMTQRKTDGTKAQAALENVARLSGPVRLTAGGLVLTGSDAGMESSGQLNPALSRWLMGVPPAWDDFACTATRSVSQRRKRLSKATLKRSA